MSESSTSTIDVPVKPIKLKIVLLGDQGVGKSSIIKNYTRGIFELKQPSTIGIDYIAKTLDETDKPVLLELWDTAGQQRFRSLIPNYLRNCAAVVVVFDLTQIETFRNIERWRDFAREVKGVGLKIFYVGNKSDLKQERTVSQELIKDLRERQEDMDYFETSAKDRGCLQAMFLAICNQLLQDENIINRFARREQLKSHEILTEHRPAKRLKNCC